MNGHNASKIGWLLAAAIALGAAPTQGEEAPEGGSLGWIGTATIGVMKWPSLADLTPPAGGGFDSTGFSLALGGHRSVAQWGGADVLLGGDFGLFVTEGNVPGQVENFTQRGLYLTPSMRLRFGDRNVRYLNLEAGAGIYKVDFAELVCDDFCREFDDPFDKNRFGGYLGVSGGFGRWFVVGLQIHHTDFGEVTGVGPGVGSLEGPIYMLNLGIAFGGR